ncbi:MAG: FAD binding domain-containing protein [Candidatus Aminicenantales bacterium]
MKNFKVAEERNLKKILSALPSERGKYFFIAGGTDLLGEIKENIISPEVVVDLNTIPGLSYIKKEDGQLHIGAMTTISSLAEDEAVKSLFPALHQAANQVATPQLRNMATAGGNLCQRPRCWYYRDPEINCRKKGGSRCFALRGRNRYHAILGGGICNIVHPSDLAPVLIALDAKITISSPGGERTIPLEEFFILPRQNVRQENILAGNEVLTEISIPLPTKGEKSSYYKFKERGAWDFALVSAAVKADVAEKTINRVKIALGGVAPIPWRLSRAEKFIKGKRPSERLLREAVREALREAKPLQENGYKKELAEVVVTRAVLSLV